ncbi:MAG TPA: HlyD family efflux transporter periplasmic adaptor subunit [Steroidobacteraceae bacterium]|nr:HlyD family efflux transporter periplasmic adaptor subunit [Steroidobacteraceae bacterium]
MKRRRILIVIVVVGLIAAGAWSFWRSRAASDPLAAFTLWGNVDVHQVELGFRVNGRISQLDVDEGDRVEVGASLARLDRVPFQTDVAAATADVAMAQAQFDKATRGYRVEEIAQAQATVRQREADLANANVTLKRLDGLFPQGAVTHQQMDDAQARVRESEAQLAVARQQFAMVTKGSRIEDIEAQQANLASAQARLARANTALEDATLASPSRGVVSVRAREVGAIVQAGQTVFTVALDDPVWIRAYVPQPRLGRIKPGMAVKIEIDSSPGRQYDGTVGFISPEAEFTPKSVQTEQVRDDLVYRIRVLAKDAEDVFRQGMPVTVRIPEAQPQVLTGSR